MKNYSIAKKVLTIFVLVTTGIIFTTFIAAVSGANYFLKSTTIDYTFRLVSQVEDTVIDYQDSMKNIANAILSDKTIVNYMQNEIEDDIEVMQTLNFAATTRDDITNIFAMRVNDDSLDIVCNDSMKAINNFANYYDSTWYKALITDGKDSVITSSYVQNLVEDQYNWVISLGVAIKGENNKTIGIILIDLNYSSIKNICDDVMPDNQGYIYLLSEDGQIVYHPHQQLIFNKVKKEDTSIVLPINNDYIQKGDKIYVVLNSHRYKWKTVAVLDETIVYRNTIINTVIFAGLGLIFIIISLYISYIFSKWLTKPIRELSYKMKKVEKGDLSVRVDVESKDEIGDLGESFNVMTERLDMSLKRIIIEQEEKRNSELNALRAQINPHFLYNTLDSIIWMAECKQTEEVVEMTSALSKMLRASINRQNDNATLKLELQNAQNYLKIQKFRYSNKLDYEINVDKKLYNKKAVHLVLQPLVENSIYHGIKSKKDGGKISINAFEKDGLLYIQVIDDGVGMSEQYAKSLLIYKRESEMGIGIYNVNRRIKLLYGDEYGLHIESEPQKGTTITIKIPSQDIEVEEDDLYESKH